MKDHLQRIADHPGRDGAGRWTSASEERLELAAQAARIGIWDWDLAANTVLYSPIAREICGLPSDGEIAYEAIRALTHPGDLPRTTALLERALDPDLQDSSPYEYRIVRPDGEVRWIVAYGRPVFRTRDGARRAVRYVGTLQDVTERRRLEEANRSYAERLRFALRTGSLGAFEYEFASGAVLADDALLEILGVAFGWPPLTLDALWERIDPRDRRRLRRIWTRARSEGDLRSADFRILRPSGEVRWCAASATVTRGADGEPARVFGYAVDITERRRTERELAERQAILQSLLDTTTLFIGVIEITDDGLVFLMLNKATADLYGVEPERAPIDARELGVTAKEIANRRAYLLEVCRKGEPQTVEHPFTINGERVAWCLGAYSPLPSGPDEAPRLSFVIIDITARKLADERQQLLAREVDHRAKNALAVAQAVVELTKEADPAAFKRAVVGRVAAIARTHSLLADGRWRGVDLRRLVMEELAPFGTDGPQRLDLDGPSHSLAPSVAQLIGLIVHELATNAAKYGALKGVDGSLRVRWSVDAAGALSLEWRESVVSGAVEAAPDRQGFGFRLLDQTISRQLGGQWAADWTPSGLVFTMTLPLGAAAPAPAAAPLQAGRPRAVVVEDEPLIALELESCLEDLGYGVLARCASLAEAANLAETRVDLAVCDVNLSGDSTFALALRLQGRGARILFCTGYAGVELPAGLEDAPVLVKPVTPDVLASAIAKLMARTAA